MSTTKARMIGGPAGGQAGEVTTPPPPTLTFGAEGGFIYSLDPEASRNGRGVVYRYDKRLTRHALMGLGLPLADVEVAVGNSQVAQHMAALGLAARPETGGYEVGVTVTLEGEVWRAYADEGRVLMDEKPREDLDPSTPDGKDALQAWAQQVGVAYIDQHKAEVQA